MRNAMSASVVSPPPPAIGLRRGLGRCEPPRRIIIVGSGVAGLSAAIWLRRFGLHPLILEQGPSVGGVLRSLHNMIPDCPGMPAISGNALANRLERHARAVGVEIQRAAPVRTLNPHAAELVTSAGSLRYDALILASGSRDRQLGVPGEREMIERGELPSADADHDLFVDKPVVVIGGGDRALEESLILANAGAKVTLVHRSERFRAQERFIGAVKDHPRIDVITPASVRRIVGSDTVSGVEVACTGAISTIGCTAALVRIGVVGNAEFADGVLDRDGDGFILVDSNHQASRPGIWAIGDVAAPAPIRSITTAMGQAALVAKQLSLQSTAAPWEPQPAARAARAARSE